MQFMCFQQFFVKVTIAVSSANQKCNAQKNKKKKYKLLFYPFCVGEILRLSAQKIYRLQVS
jgi:hypothetical protein